MGKMNLGNLGQMPFSIKDVQIEGDDAVMIVNVGRPPSYVANAKNYDFSKGYPNQIYLAAIEMDSIESYQKPGSKNSLSIN